VDFSETYVPVIRYDAIRAILVLAAATGMKLQQFEIGTAFLNGDLHEEIYIVQPPSFEDPTHPDHVCFLLKSLYGLRQSAHQWNKTMDKFLKQWELISNDPDSCVYRNKGKFHTLLGIYVDNGIIASLHPEYIDNKISYLERHFQVVKGSMEYFVGFQIEQDPVIGSIFIHQTRYINDIINRFGLKDAHSVSTPVDTHTKLSNRVDPTDPLIQVTYKEAVGCVMYATLLTRPDIAYASSLVAKFQPNPKQSHWTATKRIYRYLKGTRTQGILYKGPNSNLRLLGYSDADFAGDLDDRRSCTGYIYTISNTALS
jgi:hypothetical protein